MRSRRLAIWPLYAILLMGAVLPGVTNGALLDSFTKMAPSMQILNNSWNLAALIALISLLQKYRYDRDSLNTFAAFFALSSLPTLLSLLAIMGGYSNMLPSYLVAGGSQVVVSGWRFYTFVGGSQETALYAMFVIVFSALILIHRRQYWMTAPIFMALIIGFASGSRSFILMLSIFVILTTGGISWLYFTGCLSFAVPNRVLMSSGSSASRPIWKGRQPWGKSGIVFVSVLFLAVLLCGSWLAIHKLSFRESLSRLAESTEEAERTGRVTAVASGRDPVGQFSQVLEASLPLGNGSLNFAMINRNVTVGHNSYRTCWQSMVRSASACSCGSLFDGLSH